MVDPARTSTQRNAEDYEHKYPEDYYGEEVGPNARVWLVYLDEAREADRELIDSWKDTTDVLLIFNGLFLSVIASFVSQTSGTPQPGSNSVNWIDGLWFTALSVTLAAAFLAVLVKQWMRHYTSVVRGTPRDRVRAHQFRLRGVERWNVPLIINTLPLLVHLALLLFFIGLVLYLLPSHSATAYVTIAIASITYGFYIISNLLPLWYRACPYKTPLSSFLAAMGLLARTAFMTRHPSSRTELIPLVPKPLTFYQRFRQRRLGSRAPRLWHIFHLMREAEDDAIDRDADNLDAWALVWLYLQSSNPTVTSIVFQAISGLPNGFSGLRIIEDVFDMAIILGILETSGPKNLTKAERAARAYAHLPLFQSADPAYRAAQEKIVNDPGVLRCCVDIISLQFSKYPLQENLAKGGDAHTHLELYKDASADLPLFTWSLFLRYSRLKSFPTALVCWTHAFRVFDNFFWTYDNLRDSNTPEHWSIKFAMMFEYLCSLSIDDNSGQPCRPVPTDWGLNSVLIAYGPSEACIEALTWKSCMLPDAMRVWRTEGLSQYECADSSIKQRWTQKVSLCRILRGIRFFKHELVFSSKRDEARSNFHDAAARLHRDLQALVESSTFWERDTFPGDRELCSALLLERRFWVVNESLVGNVDTQNAVCSAIV